MRVRVGGEAKGGGEGGPVVVKEAIVEGSSEVGDVHFDGVVGIR